MEFVSDLQKDLYENFLAAQSGSFLQSWQWGDFQTTLNQKVFRVGLTKNSELELSAQFIEQIIPHLGGRYLYCPHGPVGNLELLPKLISELKSNFPNHWFIRVEPTKTFPKVGQTTLRIQPGKTLVTDLTNSEDELLSAMHNKTRYNIKVAKKHEVKIEQWSSESKEAQQALNLISQTSKRQGYTDHPQHYYQNLLKNSGNGDLSLKIYTAKYNQQLLTVSIMVDYNRTRVYLFGGSSDQHKNVMAPYLLHWQAMLDAKNNGATHYDWWGVETAAGKVPGFARFKLGWGGQTISYPVPEDSVNKPLHYILYTVLRSLNRLF